MPSQAPAENASGTPAAVGADVPTLAGAANGIAAPAAGAPPSRAKARPSCGREPTGGGTASTGQATAILAAGTFASRLTGFLRVLAIGYVLGVTSLSDAYNYANGVPNIIYDLLLGGILSATLIPVFVDQLKDEDRARSMRAISAVVSAITVALVFITGLLWLLAPWVIHFYLLLNPSTTGAAERALATQLLHYFAPQVFFLGAIVVSTALLNARRHFAAAAFSPVVNNLIAIAALLATKAVASSILTSKTSSPGAVLQRISHDQHAIWILGIGTTVGYVAQLLVQLPAMQRGRLSAAPRVGSPPPCGTPGGAPIYLGHRRGDCQPNLVGTGDDSGRQGARRCDRLPVLLPVLSVAVRADRRLGGLGSDA